MPGASFAPIDGRATLTVEQVAVGALTAGPLQATITLDAGQLAVDPLDATLAGGRLEAHLEADAAVQPPSVRLAAQATGLDLGALARALGGSAGLSAPLDATIDLAGHGASVRDLAGTASGQADVAVGRGTLSPSALTPAAAAIAQAMMPWQSLDAPMGVGCAAARFAVAGGVLTSRGLVIDTDRAILAGLGTIDLANGQIDVLLRPRSKDGDLGPKAGPVRISGPLAGPTAAPALAGDGAADPQLDRAGPLLLATPSEGGKGDRNPCLAALAGAAPKPGAAAAPASGSPPGEIDRAGRFFDKLTHSIQRSLGIP